MDILRREEEFSEEELKKAIEDIVAHFKAKIFSLMRCKHGNQADYCADCKGKTTFGPIGRVREYLRDAGILEIQVIGEEKIRGKKGAAEKMAYGIGYASGAILWIGGKIVLQLTKTKKSPPS